MLKLAYFCSFTSEITIFVDETVFSELNPELNSGFRLLALMCTNGSLVEEEEEEEEEPHAKQQLTVNIRARPRGC